MKTNVRVSIGCLIIFALILLVVAVGCVASSLTDDTDEIDIDHKRPKRPSASVSAPQHPGGITTPAKPSKAVTKAPAAVTKDGGFFSKPKTSSSSRKR